MSPLGLYIHWPFCQSKCPYCDFNSHVREAIDVEQWRQAFLDELDAYRPLLSSHQVQSIFFGGGTPSLMAPRLVEHLIDHIYKTYPLGNSLEITLEANPHSTESEKFKDFKKAGVNRISLGIQALQEDALKFLGRLHSVKEARKALSIAQNTFDNFSFDLIYARPEQTLEMWQRELREALTFGSPHLSLYQLTIEPNTAFATRYARGDFTLPSEDLAADLYEATESITQQAGLFSYEVSNYAKPGFESQHNLLYWEYEDYLGIGPGAHGRFTEQGEKKAFKNYRLPEAWVRQVQKKGHGQEEKVSLTFEERVDECLLMGLRLKKGVPESRLKRLFGDGFDTLVQLENLKWLEREGYVHLFNKNLTLTPKGILCLNTVVSELSRSSF